MNYKFFDLNMNVSKAVKIALVALLFTIYDSKSLILSHCKQSPSHESKISYLFSSKKKIILASSTDRNFSNGSEFASLDNEMKTNRVNKGKSNSPKKAGSKELKTKVASQLEEFECFKDMKNIGLLTSEEEISLARQVQVGMKWLISRDKLTEKLARKPTPSEWASEVSVDEDTLRIIIQRSERAKLTLVGANMRFAAHIANRYRYTGVSTSDLMQEASNGLMKAAERFDPDRGYKFSTYSIWWIRQSIFRAIAKHSRTIRLPGHAHDLDNSIRKATKELGREFGRSPSDQEISMHLQVSESKISFYRDATQSVMSMEHSRNGKNGISESEKEDAKISHVVCDHEPTPDESTQDSMLKDNVIELLETLNPREQEVMRLRYGLDDGNEHTLEEVGNAFCVTRERVRQIESRALQKLRQPYRNKKLKSYTVEVEKDLSSSISSSWSFSDIEKKSRNQVPSLVTR
mmetsp:Transcript_6227/g.9322  ORF Transcript_6227/g.9322 Transcript_6227/m.9322 type:complete len:462 (+) Transcript_6227:59-1444(+)